MSLRVNINYFIFITTVSGRDGSERHRTSRPENVSDAFIYSFQSLFGNVINYKL